MSVCVTDVCVSPYTHTCTVHSLTVLYCDVVDMIILDQVCE